MWYVGVCVCVCVCFEINRRSFSMGYWWWTSCSFKIFCKSNLRNLSFEHLVIRTDVAEAPGVASARPAPVSAVAAVSREEGVRG